MKINVEVLERVIRGTPALDSTRSATTSDTESGGGPGSYMPPPSLSSSSSSSFGNSFLASFDSGDLSHTSSSGTGSTSSVSGSANQAETQKKRYKLWEELYTPIGIENTKAWFLARSHKHRGSNLSYFLTENTFTQFLRQLTDLSDWEILEVFDILDRHCCGCIFWEDFFLLIALYTAYACQKTTQFLYKYGSELYSRCVDPVTSKLTFERFCRLGFLIGVSEDDILYTLRHANVQKSDVPNITVEDFVLHYHSIFSKVDSGVDLTDALAIRHQEVQPPPKQPKDRQRCTIS